MPEESPDMKSLCRMFLTVTLCVTACLAQGDRGTLTGIVTDNSGAAVANASVTVTTKVAAGAGKAVKA